MTDAEKRYDQHRKHAIKGLNNIAGLIAAHATLVHGLEADKLNWKYVDQIAELRSKVNALEYSLWMEINWIVPDGYEEK